MSAITRKAIANTLKEIAETEPINRITVTEIADRCGINRQTFYYHFRDIYNLIEWIYEQEAQKALCGNRTYATWQEGFLGIFNYIQENRNFVMKTFHSLSREHLENFLYGETWNLLIAVVEEKAEGLAVSEEDKAFIANFYKYAFVGLTLDWIDGGMEEAPETIIARLRILVQGDFQKALDAFSSKTGTH